jgi:hypothetical protein
MGLLEFPVQQRYLSGMLENGRVALVAARKLHELGKSGVYFIWRMLPLRQLL